MKMLLSGKSNKKGIYTIFTTYMLVISVLVVVAILFYVNSKMLYYKEQSNVDLQEKMEFRNIRDRLFYCFGNVVDEKELIKNFDCLKLEGKQGISIEKIGYNNCKPGHIEELNYRGFGKIEQYDISIYNEDQSIICPAKLIIYENAVIVPLILNFTIDPLVAFQGNIFNGRIRFYHTTYPSYISLSIGNGSETELMKLESGPLDASVNTIELKIDSSKLGPGLYSASVLTTHDNEFIDKYPKVRRFRVVDPLAKPVLDWFEVQPKEGSIFDNFLMKANLTDFVNITRITAIIEGSSGVVDTVEMLRAGEEIDMEEMIHYFEYAGRISASKFPNENATYTISLTVTNKLGNTATFNNVSTIKIIENPRFDVAIVAIKGNLEAAYSADQILQLENKMVEYEAAIGKDGLSAKFIYLDGDLIEQMIGTKLSGGSYTYSQIDGVIEQLYNTKEFKYLIIIGGHKRFPQAAWGSELTDDNYGDMNKDYMPDIPVGRILDPLNGDMNLMLKIIDNSIKYHNSGGLDFSSYHSDGMNSAWTSATCYNQQFWGASQTSECHIGTFDCGLNHANNKGFYMHLMHGSDVPQLFACSPGECGCGGVYPSDIAQLNLDGAFWFTMSCFGGKISNKNTKAGSMPMSFHDVNGLIYIGSTNSNLGGKLGSCATINGISFGDYYIGALYTLMTSNFEVNKRMGDAYMQGKQDYDTIVTTDPGGYHDYQIHINCFYGDPTLKIKKMW
jgi:hypothetical protein